MKRNNFKIRDIKLILFILYFLIFNSFNLNAKEIYEGLNNVKCDHQDCRKKYPLTITYYTPASENSKFKDYTVVYLPGGLGVSNDAGSLRGLYGFANIVVMSSPYKMRPTGNRGYVGSRNSKDHYQRILSVLKFYKQTGQKIILAGHSRGSQSLKYFLDQSNKDGNINLISGAAFSAIMSFVIAPKIKELPCIVLQHQKDACNCCTAAKAKGFAKSYQKKTGSLTQVSIINGGDTTGDCESGYHMYSGAALEVREEFKKFFLKIK